MLLFLLKLWITSSTRLRFETSRWRRKIRMPHPGNLSVVLQVWLAVQTSSKPAITEKVLVTALCFTWERNLHRRSDPKVHRGWCPHKQEVTPSGDQDDFWVAEYYIRESGHEFFYKYIYQPYNGLWRRELISFSYNIGENDYRQSDLICIHFGLKPWHLIVDHFDH